MNTTFPFREQVGDGHLRDGLDHLGAQVLAGYGKEHDNNTDRHSTIRATGPISERDRTAPMGEWINPAFKASSYTVGGAGNSWVVAAPGANNVLYPLSYLLVGATMWLNVDVVNSALTIAAATNTVSIQIPDTFRSAGFALGALKQRTCYGFCYLINNGAAASGILQVAPSSAAANTTVSVSKVDGTNFVTSTDFTIIGQVFFEVAL